MNYLLLGGPEIPGGLYVKSPCKRGAQEDFVVIGTASETSGTVVKYFMLLSKTVLLGSCPVFSSSLWTDCSSSCLVLK